MKLKTKQLFLGTSIALLLTTQTTFAENLDDLINNKNQLEKNESKSAERKEVLESHLHKVEKDISSLETQLAVIVSKVSTSNKNIKEKESSIVKTEKEISEIIVLIEEKNNDLLEKKEILKDNVRSMYSRGEVGFVEFLFRAENISQFVYRFQYMNDISNKGEDLYQQVVDEIQFIETQKTKLESAKNKLESEKASLISQKNILIAQENEKKEISRQLNQKQAEIEDDIEEEEQVMNYLAASIAKAEKAIVNEKSRLVEERKKAEEKRKKEEEERKKQEEQGITVAPLPSFGNGTLGTPLASGSYRISSHYGYRIHPVTGVKKLHNGTDFAAPKGTPIYAAEEGFVLFSGPAKGYGNWIVIKHPNGLYTIYGHMYSDQLYVSPGSYVSKGQKIGGVGSAGTSTGNHLHFCVATSFNGGTFTYANPSNYL